ncbi:4717_t:CDS:1, partial [Ambispora leptoticha]
LNFPHDMKIIDFDGTNFSLKIETLRQPKLARVLFLNKHTEEECEVPEDIK